MTLKDDVLKCPLCEGHGELRRSELDERFASAGIGNHVESFLAGSEAVAATPSESPAHTFAQDVHTWNPKLSMWRRSPKE
jgi:hypothetical protein